MDHESRLESHEHGASTADAAGPASSADNGRERCRCGSATRSAQPIIPLLTDDLVIVAKDRNREPELPEATVQATLAASFPTERAPYDLIRLPDPEPATTPSWDQPLLSEFAKRGHRIFWLDADITTLPPGFPAGNLLPIPVSSRRPADLFPILEAMRRDYAIATAVLFAPSDAMADAARETWIKWGWHTVFHGGDRYLRSPARDQSGLAIEALPPDEQGCPPFNLETRESDVAICAWASLILCDHPPFPETMWLGLASLESWPAKWSAVDQAIRATYPRVSIVVLSHDNRAFTRLCLWSIIANTEYPNYELIVVDNGSTDGSVDDLHRLAELHPNMRVIANERNLGFGPGNNQGIAAATGVILVFLNNDTMTPPGWLTALARHLEDARVGMIGPATNRSCNEAQIPIPYTTYREFLQFARDQMVAHTGERHAIRMPMMFCAALRRDVWNRVGPLDEQFEVGMFEDEDLALRVKAAGYETFWTPEVFVHHAYHASIGKLVPSGDYIAIFRANQRRFEEKWGISWEPHRIRA